MRVFDSNILIYHLSDALPSTVLNRIESWVAEGAVISVMCRAELLGYLKAADLSQQASRLLAYFDEIPLREPVVRRPIILRKRYRRRLPGAWIAATALDLGFPLVTRNPQDLHTMRLLN